jgi:hypothetical protein
MVQERSKQDSTNYYDYYEDYEQGNAGVIKAIITASSGIISMISRNWLELRRARIAMIADSVIIIDQG